MRLLRICPQCGKTSSGPTCQDDGWATIALERAEDPAVHAGSRILGRFVAAGRIEGDDTLAMHDGYDEARQRPVRIAALLRSVGACSAPLDTPILAALERLEHPGLARVVATGHTARGELVIVEDAVEGQSLAEMLRLGPLDARRTVELGIALLEALEAMHGIGIAHHDLTTASIRMHPEGRAVVTELGLGHLARTFGTGAPDGAASSLLCETDIYALGALLFEARTGSPYGDLLANGGSTRVGELEVEAPLRAFLDRCLDKKPWNRFEHAAMARAALELVKRELVRAPAPAGFTPVLIDLPRSEVATRETTRPRKQAPSGLLSGPAPELGVVLAAPAFGELEALDGVVTAQETVRASARPVSARPPWGWLVAAAAGIVVAAFALTRTPEDEQGTARAPLERERAPRGEVAGVIGAGAVSAFERSAEDVKAEARAAAEAVAKAAAAAQAQLRTIADTTTRAEAEAKARAEAEAKARAEAEARARAEVEAQVRAEAEAKARAEARTQAEARSKAMTARRAAAAERKASAAERGEAAEPEPRERAVVAPPAPAAFGLRRAMLVTEPSGASVHVGGALIGKSPITLSWPAGSESAVSVTHPGHEPASFTLGDRQHAKMLRLELIPLPAAP